MVRTLLVRGMLAGLVGGLLAALFAWLIGEPSVDSAIAYEDALAAAAGEEGGEPLVSRGIQSTLGLAVGYLIYGVAVGGLLALAYSAALGRFGRLGQRGTVAAVALVGFGSGVLVPFLKYPANPPASSIDDTIGTRTGLFVIVVALSVGLAIAATVLARRLSGRLGWWNAVLAATAGYVVVIGLVGFLLPVIAETPADFPATVLYEFRLASFGGQLVLWTATALVLAALVDRASRPAGTRRPVRAAG